jgi:hypothetical protein
LGFEDEATKETLKIQKKSNFVYSKGSSAFTTLADRKKPKTNDLKETKATQYDDNKLEYSQNQNSSDLSNNIEQEIPSILESLTKEDLISLANYYGIQIPLEHLETANAEGFCEKKEITTSNEDEVINQCENEMYMNFENNQLLNQEDYDVLKTIMSKNKNGDAGDADVVINSLDDEEKLNDYINQIKMFYTNLGSSHFKNINDLNSFVNY